MSGIYRTLTSPLTRTPWKGARHCQHTLRVFVNPSSSPLIFARINGFLKDSVSVTMLLFKCTQVFVTNIALIIRNIWIYRHIYLSRSWFELVSDSISTLELLRLLVLTVKSAWSKAHPRLTVLSVAPVQRLNHVRFNGSWLPNKILP